MAAYQFDKGEVENIVLDLIPQIEKSFEVQFADQELTNVSTFGELCAIVLNKVPAANANDCTPQQAFYKLRKALAPHVPGAVIMPATLLSELLPLSQKSREEVLKAVEAELGFSLDLLGLSGTAIGFIVLASLASLGAFWFGWVVGVSMLSATIIGTDSAIKLGNTLQLDTLKQVVALMTREHYAQSRRKPNTVNRSEVVKQIQELFRHDLDLELSVLTPDAQFIKKAL